MKDNEVYIIYFSVCYNSRTSPTCGQLLFGMHVAGDLCLFVFSHRPQEFKKSSTKATTGCDVGDINQIYYIVGNYFFFLYVTFS